MYSLGFFQLELLYQSLVLFVIQNFPPRTFIRHLRVTGPILFSDDPECRYYQDSDNKESADHRGQMMQFCGHDPICRKFNNPEALQKAKANVEKHYSVVGITENINMTLGEYTVALKRKDPALCTYSLRQAFQVDLLFMVL